MITTHPRACTPTSTNTSGPSRSWRRSARGGRRRGWSAGRSSCPASGRTRSTPPTTTPTCAPPAPRPTATSSCAWRRRRGSGLDRLPAAEVEELAEAWLEGALELPAPFRAWALAGCRARPPRSRDALGRGAIGLELGADLLAAPGGLDALAPMLDVLEEAQRPLLVHPGPAGIADQPGHRPAWWAPVVPYVAQLHAAWWAWACEGRERFPRLPVCFVALAGLGPLHGERRRARGGDALAVDPLTFVETS